MGPHPLSLRNQIQISHYFKSFTRYLYICRKLEINKTGISQFLLRITTKLFFLRGMIIFLLVITKLHNLQKCPEFFHFIPIITIYVNLCDMTYDFKSCSHTKMRTFYTSPKIWGG